MAVSKQRARVKRKRAPGGGRKPKGEFAGLESPLSIRMPAEMRARLAASARRSNRSLSQEVLARLNRSLNKDIDKSVDPAMRAICFLISSLAYSIHWNMPNWRSDPFMFKAIKIGIGKLLDALEPSGEIRLPHFWKVAADMPINEGNETLMKLQEAMQKGIMTAIQSPEAMADHAVQTVLQNYTAPRPPNWEALRGVASQPGWVGEIGGKILKRQEDFTYGMKDAQKDLRIKGEKQ